MTQIPSHDVIKTKLSWMRDILLGCRKEEGAALQIALQLPTADSHLEPATITTILLSFADHQEFSYYWQSVLPYHYLLYSCPFWDEIILVNIWLLSRLET